MSYTIDIELNSRQLILKQDNRVYNHYPVAIGKPSTPTPTGDYQILNKIRNPGGVLGTRWIQFTWQEHGIHGTNQPWLIGQAVSNGCVRMYNRDVELVFERVTVGTPVIIRHNFGQNNPPVNPRNGISNPDQRHFIYTVRKGDSLWKISRRYNVSVEIIRTLNNISGDLIYPGQKLKIPISQA
ncbi:MAG TPA: L,D-transpeptidase family protein [Halanaerobiales bacterium]|nr:L,D-transpeptidase family protein [Halanaerobiales bacterium]